MRNIIRWLPWAAIIPGLLLATWLLPAAGSVTVAEEPARSHGLHVGEPDQPPDETEAVYLPFIQHNYPKHTIVQGAYIPPINMYGTELLAFNDLVGKDLGIVNYYMGWFFAPNAYPWLPDQIEDQIPPERWPQIMLSWIPVGRDCRVHPPDEEVPTEDRPSVTSLYDIRDGYCDEYIRLVAQELKNLPFTFMLRFAHEMNLQSQIWWVGHFDGDPQLYIDAYRRIYDVFAAEGLTNVQWVWSPNYASSPREEWNSLFNYYPGDAYVDWVGLSVYNWGDYLDVPWWSLTDLLDSDTWDHVMSALMCSYAKPIVLELASVEGSRPGDGTKAEWVLDAYQQVDQFPFVRALVWFNDYDFGDPDLPDLRVVGGSSRDPDPWHEGYAYPLPEGSGVWTQAYIEAVARDEITNYVPPLEEITPPSTYCND
jgi:hypothetical protein